MINKSIIKQLCVSELSMDPTIMLSKSVGRERQTFKNISCLMSYFQVNLSLFTVQFLEQTCSNSICLM